MPLQLYPLKLKECTLISHSSNLINKAFLRVSCQFFEKPVCAMVQRPSLAAKNAIELPLCKHTELQRQQHFRLWDETFSRYHGHENVALDTKAYEFSAIVVRT